MENKKSLKRDDELIILIGARLFSVKKRYAYGK